MLEIYKNSADSSNREALTHEDLTQKIVPIRLIHKAN